jgi:hypothetical protein
MVYFKKNLIYLILALFLLTFVVDGFLFSSPRAAQGSLAEPNASSGQISSPPAESEFIINGEEIIKVKTPAPGSSLREAVGRLDEGAVSITVTPVEKIRSLPPEIWIFLLLAFMALLIFNLAYNFKKTLEIRWGFEAALLILTLWAWLIFDQGRAVIWFPLYVIKLGLIIYLAYLYFFEKKEKIEPEQDSLF